GRRQGPRGSSPRPLRRRLSVARAVCTLESSKLRRLHAGRDPRELRPRSRAPLLSRALAGLSAAGVAAEMLGRDALGPALAGKARHRSEGGRGQVVPPAVVLGASPAGPDGHHLEADEAPLLPVEASRTEELHLQAALLTAWPVHVAIAADRPVSPLY